MLNFKTKTVRNLIRHTELYISHYDNDKLNAQKGIR